MNVRFLNVKLRATFDALQTKEVNALYWIEETQELYKGDKLFGTGRIASAQAAGLLSPEDYTALQALIAGGTGGSGIGELTPVDGSIIITKQDNMHKIGVAISAGEGNMLTLKEDGLYAQMPEVAEYAIEKQGTADEGFAATYRLKKTVGDVVSYVGDAINIANGLILQSATLETVTEDGVPYADAKVGDPYIKMVFNNVGASNLYIPVKGLVDTYVAGEGIEIVDNQISVKLASDANGLVAVDGALMLNLATKDAAGAMSKEDKTFIDLLRELNIPGEYITKDEMQELVDAVAQIEEAYLWGNL